MGSNMSTGTRQNQRVDHGAKLNETRYYNCYPSQNQGGPNYIATTISFTAPNTIADSANGLGFLTVGQIFRIQGSGINDRMFEVLTTGAGSITVEPSTQVQTLAAGPKIILRADE